MGREYDDELKFWILVGGFVFISENWKFQALFKGKNTRKKKIRNWKFPQVYF